MRYEDGRAVHVARHNDEPHWYSTRAVIRALRRDPVAASSNATREGVKAFADRFERGELVIVSRDEYDRLK
jgi:hypothetical protein